MEARWFIRPAAVLVVLAHFFGGNPALPTGVSWEAVSLRGTIPYVLVAVAAGLAAGEVTLRRLDRLSAFGRFVFFEKLLHPNAGVVGAVCLGGVLVWAYCSPPCWSSRSTRIRIPSGRSRFWGRSY